MYGMPTKGVRKIYWGESHRSGWDRASDHQKALKTQNKAYAIVKHQLNDHNEEEVPNFQFNVVQSFTSSLERQIREAIAIDSEDPEAKLNSKAEWGMNAIPRIVVVQDTPESQDQHQNQGQEGEADHVGQNNNLFDKTRARGNNKSSTNTTMFAPTKKRKLSMPETDPNSSSNGVGKTTCDHHYLNLLKIGMAIQKAYI